MNTTSDRIEAAEPKLTVSGQTFEGRLSATHVFDPTPIFCLKDGALLQLWTTRYSDVREWRPMPSFAEASAMYKCWTIK